MWEKCGKMFKKVSYLCGGKILDSFVMACNFSIKKDVKSGMTPVMLKVRSRKLNIDVRQTIKFEVDAYKWNSGHSSPQALANFRKSVYGQQVFNVLDKIAADIEAEMTQGVIVTAEQVRKMSDNVIFAEQRKRDEEARLAEAAKEAEAKRVTLNKYIARYIAEVEAGERQTDKGTKYSPNTIKSIKQALTQFEEFQKSKKKRYDFNDIDMKFYQDYTAWLRKKNYAINSIGKCIKQLKVIMFASESEGYHHNSLWKDKRFKGTRVDIDSIYLTKEDLEKFQSVDMTKLSPGHEIARDIFMVGVWTAQRVSDYNNIGRDDIQTLTIRSIVDEPDPENAGKTIAKIVTREVTVINIRQKKTGAKVAIPCSSDLKRILEKYNFQMPHLEDQVINRYIKDIGKAAGLTEIVNIVKTNGGEEKEVPTEKYKLIHTHTARRTGATLMYLSGMDVYDIIKITGHTSPVMLRKYIKADELEVVEKITEKYKYFD